VNTLSAAGSANHDPLASPHPIFTVHTDLGRAVGEQRVWAVVQVGAVDSSGKTEFRGIPGTPSILFGTISATQSVIFHTHLTP